MSENKMYGFEQMTTNEGRDHKVDIVLYNWTVINPFASGFRLRKEVRNRGSPSWAGGDVYLVRVVYEWL